MTTSVEKHQVNKWIVAFTVMLPTFIEIMDISVVNVSLPHIQGSLSAGLDEVTWILTSYLVSNAVIIPISGWLAGIFGRKRYLIFSLILFTASSVLCGSAFSLAVIIGARIFQGIGGGGLQPISQAILLESFPAEERGLAMAFFGMGVVLAPILGPVLGGWLTDTWNWRWVFYINLPAGILAIALVFLFVHDPGYIRRHYAKIDIWGLFFLTIGLGCLQIVLDKGQRNDWFNSNFIVTLSLISGIALILFVKTELRSPHPVVNLKVFKDRSFAMGNLIMFTGFFCLFGSIVLLPLYLQNLMGYTAFWAGLVLGPGGIAAFFVMPLAGLMMKKNVSPRLLLAIGLIVSAGSLYLMSGFNLNASFQAVALPRIIQGFGLGLFFVPLSAATFAGIRKEETGNASGIFNLLRNLGGSFGVALSTTVLARRTQMHQTFLAEHVTSYNPSFQHYYHQIQQWLQIRQPRFADPSVALGEIYRRVLEQAHMLAFNDTFWLLALGTAALVPLTAFFRQRSDTALGAGIP
jgi:DHA2 family multidrug resistance protein